jgi:ribosomal protein S18 acetylase RimI-like enzyme
MKSVSVRNGKKKDAPIIEKLIAEWLKWEIPRKDSINRAVENNELLVAEWQGEIAGFIHYAIHEDIIDGGVNAFITCLFVASEFRNRGIGSQLLRRTIEDALANGAVGVETSTANPDARRFYEKHNFEQFMGEWKMGEVFLELNMKKKARIG